MASRPTSLPIMPPCLQRQLTRRLLVLSMPGTLSQTTVAQGVVGESKLAFSLKWG
jgi:hypothetical protein